MNASRGFTLLEFLLTIAVIGILSAYAVPKFRTPGALTVQPQAQSLADFVRRAQSIAMARRQRVSVTVANTTQIRLACTPTACSTDQTLNFEQSASLAGTTAVIFNSWGVPVDTAGTPRTSSVSYTLTHATGGTYNVTVAPLTGRVTLTP